LSYQTVQLGNLSGGINEVLPASRIGENEAAVLDNFEYLAANPLPQTRRGTNFLAAFDDDVVGVHPLHTAADTTESHLMVVTNTGTETEFWGRDPAGSFTSRGTLAFGSIDWKHVVMNDLLVMFSPSPSIVPQKWTGTGNKAALAGSPPSRIYDACVWNNRMFAVAETDRYAIEFCQLGDVEDWTDTDPVSGSGFIEMTTGADPIVSIVAHRERLIIFRQNSIWQIIASLPNTDPDGWRMELITDEGGCDSKYAVHPLYEDLIFHASSKKGIQSLRAIEQFGDFTAKSLSLGRCAMQEQTTGLNNYYASTLENKYLIASTFFDSSALLYCMDVSGEGAIRWTRFKFRGNIGDVVSTSPTKYCANRFYIGGIERIVFVASAAQSVIYWPNSGTGDDAYVDYYQGTDGDWPITGTLKTRAWSGDTLLETKQLKAIGLALRRLSTARFTATGELQVKLYFNESSTAAHTFNLTDTTAAEQTKRLAPWGTAGRRFQTVQVEIIHSKSGTAIMLKDLDALVTFAYRAFSDTMAQV
jgi:hypothetical protein